jgi:hypothetical protein
VSLPWQGPRTPANYAGAGGRCAEHAVGIDPAETRDRRSYPPYSLSVNSNKKLTLFFFLDLSLSLAHGLREALHGLCKAPLWGLTCAIFVPLSDQLDGCPVYTPYVFGSRFGLLTLVLYTSLI